MLEVGFQTNGQVPQADGEERDDDGATDDVKIVPEGRLEPRDEEGREEERDGREDRLLEREVLAPVFCDQLVNPSAEASLSCDDPPQPLRVLVARMDDRASEVAAVKSCKLSVVVSPLDRKSTRLNSSHIPLS